MRARAPPADGEPFKVRRRLAAARKSSALFSRFCRESEGDLRQILGQDSAEDAEVLEELAVLVAEGPLYAAHSRVLRERRFRLGRLKAKGQPPPRDCYFASTVLFGRDGSAPGCAAAS